MSNLSPEVVERATRAIAHEAYRSSEDNETLLAYRTRLAKAALTAALGDEFVLVPREPPLRLIIDMHAAIDSSEASSDSVGYLIGYAAIREAYDVVVAAATPKAGG